MKLKNMKHVYDWLEEPPQDDGEKIAKEWLDKFCRPEYYKYKNSINEWLEKRPLFCDWKGGRYQCSGASRMGDVWIKNKESENFYDHRVEVGELSNWGNE